MHNPAIAALRGTFVILGTLCAYYLVEGFREGRFHKRFTFRLRQLPFRNGRDPCYFYRDDDAIGFWLSAFAQFLAVAISILMFCVLLTVP